MKSQVYLVKSSEVSFDVKVWDGSTKTFFAISDCYIWKLPNYRKILWHLPKEFAPKEMCIIRKDQTKNNFCRGKDHIMTYDVICYLYVVKRLKPSQSNSRPAECTQPYCQLKQKSVFNIGPRMSLSTTSQMINRDDLRTLCASVWLSAILCSELMVKLELKIKSDMPNLFQTLL